MLKNTVAVVSATLSLFVSACRTPASTAETRPAVSALLRQVEDTYHGMHSYESTGDLTENMSTGLGGLGELHFRFAMKLARPNFYRIEWEEHEPNEMAKGAVWYAGDGNFVTGPHMASPLHAKDMTTALSMATGISGGAAYTLPSIFFGLKPNTLAGLKDAALERDAVSNGEPCFVIVGKSVTGGETIWVSKKSKLILQIRDEFKGAVKFPAFTDQQIKEVLQSMNQTPTPDAINRMKAQMTLARTIANSGIRGYTTQVYRQIVVNAKLSKADFAVKALETYGRKATAE